MSERRSMDIQNFLEPQIQGGPMRSLRFRFTILTLWLVGLYGLDQLVLFFDLSGVAYISISILVAIFFATPHRSRIHKWIIPTIPVGLFLFASAATGGFRNSGTIVRVILECCAVTGTGFLLCWVDEVINHLESSTGKNLIGPNTKQLNSALMGQGYMYREVRRARNHQRPLAMMAITAIKSDSANSHLANKSGEKEEMLASVSNVLCDQLEDCSIIMQNDDRYLITLPETQPEDLIFIAERLRKHASATAGVELIIGTSIFPKDSYTYDGLVEIATQNMTTALKPYASSTEYSSVTAR